MQVNICQQIKIETIPETSEKWFVIENKSNHSNDSNDRMNARYMGINGKFYPSMSWSETKTGGKYFDTQDEAVLCVQHFGYEVVEEEIYDIEM